MRKKIRKHLKQIDLTYLKPKITCLKNKDLILETWDTPLNKALTDRVGFTVKRDSRGHLQKIDRITYETVINGRWEWIFRFDDHGGTGVVHGHRRVSLRDTKIKTIT